MLKHISPAQLRLGMYIHALDGSWLNHGFWKNSFMLKTEADLQRLQVQRSPAAAPGNNPSASPLSALGGAGSIDKNPVE